jgi:hypothetical protein
MLDAANGASGQGRELAERTDRDFRDENADERARAPG